MAYGNHIIEGGTFVNVTNKFYTNADLVLKRDTEGHIRDEVIVSGSHAASIEMNDSGAFVSSSTGIVLRGNEYSEISMSADGVVVQYSMDTGGPNKLSKVNCHSAGVDIIANTYAYGEHSASINMVGNEIYIKTGPSPVDEGTGSYILSKTEGDLTSLIQMRADRIRLIGDTKATGSIWGFVEGRSQDYLFSTASGAFETSYYYQTYTSSYNANSRSLITSYDFWRERHEFAQPVVNESVIKRDAIVRFDSGSVYLGSQMSGSTTSSIFIESNKITITSSLVTINRADITGSFSGSMSGSFSGSVEGSFNGILNGNDPGNFAGTTTGSFSGSLQLHRMSSLITQRNPSTTITVDFSTNGIDSYVLTGSAYTFANPSNTYSGSVKTVRLFAQTSNVGLTFDTYWNRVGGRKGYYEVMPSGSYALVSCIAFSPTNIIYNVALDYLYTTASHATTADIALAVEFDNVLNKPTLVSSSAQINTGSFSGSFRGQFTGSLLGTTSYASFALSASYASNVPTTSSWSIQATTASFIATASWANNSRTASYVLNAVTASFISTASWASNARTASYVTFDNVANKPTLVSSSAQINTGSFTGSFVGTASYAINATYAVSSSYSLSGSFCETAQTATTSSYSLNAGTASYFVGFMESASYSETALTASHAIGARQLTSASLMPVIGLVFQSASAASIANITSTSVGAGFTMGITGSNHCGKINLRTTSVTTTGEVFRVTFSVPKLRPPCVFVTPRSVEAGASVTRTYFTTTTASFSMHSFGNLNSTSDFGWDYLVMDLQ